MARDIEQRYRNMEELAGDLRAYIEGRVVKAHETGTWAETKQWVRRNRALTLAVCAAMLALIGGISFTLLEQRKTERANLELRAQAREQELRGMIQEVGRFRAQCRSTDGLQRLDRPAWQWWLLESAKLLQGEAGDEPGAAGHATDRKWRPGLADVRAKLGELRAQALPWTDEDRERDRATHPLQARIRDLEEERDEQLEALRSEADRAAGAAARADARAAHLALPRQPEGVVARAGATARGGAVGALRAPGRGPRERRNREGAGTLGRGDREHRALASLRRPALARRRATDAATRAAAARGESE
jgi:hypothetical protein